ncbi:uncharacterized protein IWZ02DRAFT_54047 [Phyllosticta citriasiana]|uniref:Secreted protein n=1 Tax=Phyllosticta citriasiana TaxID=595635 RepID=A0ABR1KEL1_9PEZI
MFALRLVVSLVDSQASMAEACVGCDNCTDKAVLAIGLLQHRDKPRLAPLQILERRVMSTAGRRSVVETGIKASIPSVHCRVHFIRSKTPSCSGLWNSPELFLLPRNSSGTKCHLYPPTGPSRSRITASHERIRQTLSPVGHRRRLRLGPQRAPNESDPSPIVAPTWSKQFQEMVARRQ